jgi:hypothetical protein
MKPDVNWIIMFIDKINPKLNHLLILDGVGMLYLFI